MKRTVIYRLFSTHSKICIIAAGTGGISVSTNLLRANIPASDIRIIQPHDKHYYQPGWTMVGAGLCSKDLTWRYMKDIIPKQIGWTRGRVSKVDPQNQIVQCDNGQKVTYEHLIVSSGLRLNWHQVKGCRQALQNPNKNVGSIYQFSFAQKTAQIAKRFKGGNAIFTEPPMPIKCAGAPQKILYLWTDEWKKANIVANVEFCKAVGVMFAVPKYSQALTKIAKGHNIGINFKHNLVQVKDDIAVFQNPQTKQRVQKSFNFLHITPPMGPHPYISQSGLSDSAGYLDVDKFTLRHQKYPNIWGIGDCTNTPNSKTAAAVFSQTQTLVKNFLQALKNKQTQQLPSKYQGYASCPLFVGGKKLLLAQFKYGGVIDQTFYDDQEKPREEFYYLKRYLFPHIYWHLVPRGLWKGRKGINFDI